MIIGCLDLPKPSYPPYFDQLSERYQPLCPEREARGPEGGCALRTLGLLLADGAPKLGWGKTFWRVGRVFFKKKAVSRKHKVEKSI